MSLIWRKRQDFAATQKAPQLDLASRSAHLYDDGSRRRRNALHRPRRWCITTEHAPALLLDPDGGEKFAVRRQPFDGHPGFKRVMDTSGDVPG
jgi:hypothetical protein